MQQIAPCAPLFEHTQVNQVPQHLSPCDTTAIDQLKLTACTQGMKVCTQGKPLFRAPAGRTEPISEHGTLNPFQNTHTVQRHGAEHFI
jgi:hypothetical protein